MPVDQLVRESVRRNKKLSAPYVDLWVVILDEFISWKISLFTIVYGERKDSLKNFDTAMASVLAKLIADAIAIRHLILAGYDVQAKVLLRSTSEYLELAVAILDDPTLADEFVSADLPETSKAFWSKHLARGEIRKKMKAAWSRFMGHEDAANWMSNWGHGWLKTLSSLSHPSFMGGYFSAIPFKRKHNNEKWLGFFGDKSDGSVETVMTYAAYFFPLLLLQPEYPFSGFDKFTGKVVAYDEKNEFHKHVKTGREILASLVLSLGKKSNARLLFPKLDMSIYPKQKAVRRQSGVG